MSSFEWEKKIQIKIEKIDKIAVMKCCNEWTTFVSSKWITITYKPRKSKCQQATRNQTFKKLTVENLFPRSPSMYFRKGELLSQYSHYLLGVAWVFCYWVTRPTKRKRKNKKKDVKRNKTIFVKGYMSQTRII
jgi:hypothetical protein